MTPDKVKVEVMYKLFHQHMPPDKVKVEVMGIVEMPSESCSSSCSRGSRGRGGTPSRLPMPYEIPLKIFPTIAWSNPW
jgi:hypothetical protein